MDLDTWFKERTFHNQKYQDLNKLIKQKEEKNLTISLCLPTKNEGITLKPTLETIKRDTMEKYPLVDQLIVMDSHSTDNTWDIAQELSVPIYNDDEVLTEAGSYIGKGEAIWKSLFIMSGDLIGWVDADIKNFDSHFVYGLFGPLIENSEIGFIKAYYQRPIKEHGVLKDTGGGRVTEILARPVINLFYPELAGFIQLLSGEYAGRKEVLESIPYFTGYAVELGMLIEIFRKYGLYEMAQVDLVKRIHRNQPTKALGRMSFAILQAIFKFLEEDSHIDVQSELNRMFHYVSYEKGVYHLSPQEIKVIERPPVVEFRKNPELKYIG